MPEIAIDACVFIHLLNPQNNEGSHIDKLLTHLYKENFNLIVDSTGRIEKDYIDQVVKMIKEEYETGTQLFLLRLWMLGKKPIVVDLKATDQLMTAIKNVIYEPKEHADRAFVYVSCKHGVDLISNDDIHILSRRGEILKVAKKCGHKNTEIVSSREAYEGLPHA